MDTDETEPGTRFLVIEIPASASDDDAEALAELVAEAAYDYEPTGENKAWDPFIYGWMFPQGQAVERPRREVSKTECICIRFADIDDTDDWPKIPDLACPVHGVAANPRMYGE